MQPAVRDEMMVPVVDKILAFIKLLLPLKPRR
jgi:hypothetical protein